MVKTDTGDVALSDVTGYYKLKDIPVSAGGSEYTISADAPGYLGQARDLTVYVGKDTTDFMNVMRRSTAS